MGAEISCCQARGKRSDSFTLLAMLEGPQKKSLETRTDSANSVLDIDDEEAACLAVKIRADAEIRRRSKIIARSNSLPPIPEGGKENGHAQAHVLPIPRGPPLPTYGKPPFVVPLGA